MREQLYIRLREIRKKNGYTQSDIANYLGISRQAISQWENGNAYPDIDNIIFLSRFYNITVSELLGEEENIVKETLEISKDNIASTECTESEENVCEKNMSSALEFLAAVIILIAASQIPFVGIITVLAAFRWIRKKELRERKICYLLMFISSVLGIYNTYIFVKHYIFTVGVFVIDKL